MRKHNKHTATRWGRTTGDRSNFASSFSHKLANDKGFQLGVNALRILLTIFATLMIVGLLKKVI